MKAYVLKPGAQAPATLERVEQLEPLLGPGQARVRMHAASLNARDILILQGTYGVQPKVPLSDGAGEVVEVAPDVTRVKVGDRVVGTFRQTHIAGELTPENLASTLGGEQEGVLAESVVFHQQGLVKLPEYFSFEEGATLPCAAVTAWNALVVEAKIKAGDKVLLLGTGGVSVFALQFAKAMGAEVIITSSSDEKLKRAQSLGADHLINYRSKPDWANEVLALTGGKGVDIVLELGGAQSLAQSVKAVRVSGQIEVIGVISGMRAEVEIGPILGNHLRVQGISVGSRDSFEAMIRAIVQNKLRPVIDKVFPFDRADDAVAYLTSGDHFGKVVITV